jgi:uncharacterized membrane protein
MLEDRLNPVSPPERSQPEGHNLSAHASADGVGFRASVEYRESGPIPSPFVLERIEKLVPGSAARYIDEGFRQSEHRMDMERKVTRWESRRATFGLVSGFVTAVASLGVCTYAIANGAAWVASILGSGTLAALVYALIYGTRTRKDERIEQTKILARVTEPPEE